MARRGSADEGAVTDETWKQHFSAHPDSGGGPTKERFVERHAPPLWPMFKAPRPEVLKATLLMGAPGSGKSSLRGLVPTHPEIVRINPDEFKSLLPEYAGGSGAATVHEESSWMAAQARAVAIGRGCCFVNDAVGANLGKYAELIRKLKNNKYTVHLICVHVLDVEELIRRVAYRGQRTGRYVNVNVVRDAHAKIPKSFNVLRAEADQWLVMDGASGKPAWEGNSTASTVHDHAFVSTLLAAAT